MRSLLITALLAAGGCTWHHSRQALGPDYSITPADDATFVSEEDSGLTLFRIITLSEPDHYAVLVERMRQRYRCAAIHHLQLDLYTDDWLILEFPIVRLTAICDREEADSGTGKKPRGGKEGKASKAVKSGKAPSGAAKPETGDEKEPPVEKGEPATPDAGRDEEPEASAEAVTDGQT
jgi:hypothetical protein